MSDSTEHMKKYSNNRYILDEVFDIKNKEHYDWIATVSFYAALHIIEAEFSKKSSVSNRTHKEREEHIRNDGIIQRKVANNYKLLSDYSKTARYGPGFIQPTIAQYSLKLLSDIEKELGVR